MVLFQSTNVIADIMAQPGLKLENVDSNSTWTNGFQMMILECKNFPIQTIHETKLNQ